MAESAVSFLLDQLSSLLGQEYTQLTGFRREFQSIKEELGSMRAFLRDAEARQDAGELDPVDQEWIKQVRDAANDTQEVVDEYLFRFGHHKAPGFRGHVRETYTSLGNLRARHQISSKIREINDRIKRISERHQRYATPQGGSMGHGSREIPQNPTRNHDLLIEETKLVGIEVPKWQIISHILDSTYHLKVVSVVGMGGLGKTTMVRRVYEAAEVRSAFSCHAWVTVSQTYQTKDVLHKLMRELNIPRGEESLDDNELRARVKDFLKGKRYVIVLDDVWTMDAWESIKYAFPNDANCYSRVILTTRMVDVATMCCRDSGDSKGYLHEMKPLSPEASWTLFCRKIFGEDSCPPNLEEISRSILRKCEGLPLGIVAIAGLLAARGTSRVDEWEMVRRCLGGELEGSGKLDRVRRILLLSYNDLPYYLKACLICMGMYPEDRYVWKRELIWLWIAQGFVEERRGMSLEEVAESYLNDLINRSLLQVKFVEWNGKPSDFHVHDLLHEIIVSKCRDYNILTLHLTSCPILLLPETVRCLKLYLKGDVTVPFHLPRLRFLVIEGYTNSLSNLLKSVPKSIKGLDIPCRELKNIPDEIFKLYHLSNLRLYETSDIKRIPKAIGKLRNLEFLDLGDTKVKELPVEVLKLQKLRHLHVFGHPKAPDNIGVLSSLEVLLSVQADNDKCLREVGKLTQLRELGIKIKGENGRQLCSSLVKLTNLRSLYIESASPKSALDLEYSRSSSLQFLQKLVLRGQLEKVPDWVPSLLGLARLFLDGSNLREDLLKSIADLPNLEVLDLQDDAYAGDSLYFKARKFQKLKRLHLSGLRRLRRIILEDWALSSLIIFFMYGCPLLEELPERLTIRNKATNS